ncbi:MAG TPA: hypothetical protein VI643_07980 [Planctomycetota bacterium]|nr:hypothetical protein [Planctomycetota bacterium]
MRTTISALLLLAACAERPPAPLPEVGEDGHAHYMQIPGLDVAGLDEDARKRILLDANHRGCGCGCGMTVAQCLVTDPTCPVREKLFRELQETIDRARRR